MVPFGFGDMNNLRKEVGMQCSLTGRLVRSQMRRAGHLVWMDEGKLAEVEKHQGRRKRGMPLREEGYEKIGRG